MLVMLELLKLLVSKRVYTIKKLNKHIGSAYPRYVLAASQPLLADQQQWLPVGTAVSCPVEAHRVLYLLSFGSDPKMGSAEMLSAFSFLNLAMLSCFPLKTSEDSIIRYLNLVVAFLYKIQSFFFPFWANSEFWFVVIYQVILTRSLAKQSLA